MALTSALPANISLPGWNKVNNLRGKTVLRNFPSDAVNSVVQLGRELQTRSGGVIRAGVRTYYHSQSVVTLPPSQTHHSYMLDTNLQVSALSPLRNYKEKAKLKLNLSP